MPVLSPRLIMMILVGVLTAVDGFLLWVRVRREQSARQCLQAPWVFAAILMGCGVLLGLPVFIWDVPQALAICGFGVLSLCAAAFCLNQRLIWDDRGFWYRTILGRTVHYDYADIRRVKKVGSSSPAGADLYVRAGHRRILLDSFMLWERFAGAYENWQTRNGLPSWRQTEKERFEEKYRRHGPFRRKLDRIPGGYFMFILSTCFGGFMLTLGIYLLCNVSSLKDVLICLAGLVIGGWSFSYHYAVAHLDDKPRLIRKWVKGRIRPDPDAKPKVYKRRKR